MPNLIRYIFIPTVFLILFHGARAQDGSIKDIDGNEYNVGKIGEQWWMEENLKTGHFADGSVITEVESKTPWINADQAQSPAWCYYNGTAENKPIYGKLYNWYAVADSRHLCPNGWHVPTDEDFKVLTDFLGGIDVAGGKMKATTLWAAPNAGGDNSSGFAALPGGSRTNTGSFFNLTNDGIFWSATPDYGTSSWSRYLYANYSFVTRYSNPKGYGFSVRCVAD